MRDTPRPTGYSEASDFVFEARRHLSAAPRRRALSKAALPRRVAEGLLCPRGYGDFIDRYDLATLTIWGHRVAVHRFRPETHPGAWPPAGCERPILFLHGLIRHGLAYPRLMRLLTEWGYTVYAPDLPGHGLSSGGSAHVSSYAHYRAVINDVVNAIGGASATALTVIATSNGAAALLEYLRFAPDPAFDRIVLVAPFLRPARRAFAALVAALGPRLARSLPANDPEGAQSADPLVASRLSTATVSAWSAWYRRLSTLPSRSERLFVIQGDKDAVVDARYARSFLRLRFAACKYESIPDAGHGLLNAKGFVGELVAGALNRALR